MRIIPVIDLKQQQVVHARAGNRDAYQPIQSQLCDSSSPFEIASAFVRLGFEEAYVADLDAILGNDFDTPSYDEIARAGLRLWVDAGITCGEAAQVLAARADVSRIILGLESMRDVATAASLTSQMSHSRIMVSIDLKNSRPLTRNPQWRNSSPLEIVDALTDVGVTSFILLDLGRVGVGEGPGTEELCETVRKLYPHVELTCGGGIRDQADIDRLANAGANSALIATSLHDGRISPAIFKSKN